MSHALLSQENVFDLPCCPHCSGLNMGNALMTLESLLDAWPLHRFVPVGDDGYARPEADAVTLVCPDCERPSKLRVTELRVMLVASRTEKDLRLVAEVAL